MTGKLVEGTVYVFEFKTFEVEIPADQKKNHIFWIFYLKDINYYSVEEDD